VGADRENDAVVRSPLGVASPAISADDPNAGDAGGGQVCPGGGHDVVVDVDRGHPAGGAHEMGEERGVVPRAGAYLEHPLARPHVKLLKHRGHDLGLRG
jgi:hypothetical protein